MMLKKVRGKLLAMILAFFMITGFMPVNFNSTAQAFPGAGYDYNLIFNGDAETDDAQMVGWTEPTSPYFVVITEESGLLPEPYSSNGGNVFDLYTNGSTATDSISQTIDIFNLSDDIAAGLVNVDLSAETRKLKAESVHTLTMELLDDSAEVLQTYSNSGSSMGDNVAGEWQDIVISQDCIDANTASIRITLTAGINTSHTGDFVEFDGVSLILTKEVPSISVPGAPTNVIATAGDGQASVVFSAPVYNGGSPIDGYMVTSNPAAGTDTNAGSADLTHTITGLTNGTSYTFTVTAVNAAGSSETSAPSNSVTPVAEAPAAIAPVVTTDAATDVDFTEATLNGTVNANGDSTSVSFEYGLTAAYGSTATASQSPVTGNSDIAVSTVIAGLDPDTLYHFRVVGYNAGGSSNGSDQTFTTDAITANGAFIIGDGSGGGGGGASGSNLSGGNGGNGGGDNDIIHGTAYDDVIFGDGSGGGAGGRSMGSGSSVGGLAGSGSDIINGGAGDDVIFGDGFDGKNGGFNPGKGGIGGGGGGGAGGAFGAPPRGGLGGIGAGGGGGGGSGTGYGGETLIYGIGSPGQMNSGAGGNSAATADNISGLGGAPAYNAGGGGAGFGGAAGGAAKNGANGLAGADGNTSQHTYNDNEGKIRAYFTPVILGTILKNNPAYGSGNDIIDGGSGSNDLFGLGGSNIFIVEADDAASGNQIWDFKYGDTLLLKNNGVQVTREQAKAVIDNAEYGDFDNDGYNDDTRIIFSGVPITLMNIFLNSDYNLMPTGEIAAVNIAYIALSLNGSPMAEDGGTAEVIASVLGKSTLDINEAIPVNLDLTGTATGEIDYSSEALIVIPAGSLTESMTIVAINDVSDEEDETIVISISSVTNGLSADQQVTAIISDDDAPPSVMTGAATSITKTGATLNGTVKANGTSTTARFEYGLTAAYGSTATASQGLISGSDDTAVSVVLNGLTANTTYHYRAVAINATGTSYGADQTFTTSSAITYNDVTKTYGDSSFIHTASGGSSTGAFSYTSSNPAVAAIDAASGSVTILKAGTVNLTATKAGDDNYKSDSQSCTLTVNKALLVATVGNYNRTYGEANLAFAVDVTGFVNGETAATASGYTAPTAGSTATATTGAGTAAITISGGAANNYTFNISDTGVLTIDKAVLTATVVDYSKSYGEDNPAFAVSVTGFVNGETSATAAGYATPTASSTATATTGAGTASITISGGAADNYTFNISDTGILTINKAVLTATVGDYSKSYGEANPTFDVTVKGFKNGETAATAAGYTAPTASSTATAETGAGTASITISGGVADNYAFNTSDTGVLTINKAAISGISFDNASATYDGLAKTILISGTLPDGASVEYSENSGTDAGAYNATAEIIGGDNYNNIVLNAVLTINKALLTATVEDYSRTYGEANPAFAVKVSGFKNGETVVTAAGYAKPTASSTATNVTGAGTAAITISGGAADNYTFNISDTGVLTIDKAVLTATVGDYNKSYGEANPTFEVDVTGFVNGETSGTAAGYTVPTASSTATDVTGAGTASITISGGAADNYTFNISDTGVLTINKALLTATVEDYSKIYGEANPAFDVTVNGFKNGETSATAAGYITPTASSTATAESEAGTAEITISGGAADHYTFDISDQGVLTINPRELTATAHVNTKYYDGRADATGIINLTGIIFDDEVTATGIFTFENGKTGRNKIVYVTDISLAGADAANYSVIDSTTLRADITLKGDGSDYEPPTRSDLKQIEILINGKRETAATATTTSVNGQTVTTVLLDASKVAEKLEQAGKQAIVSILAPNDSEALVGQLTGQTVKNMENYQALLEIKNGDVTYTLRAAQLNIEEIAARLGNPALKDIVVSIKTARPSEAILRTLQDKADKNGYKLMMEPIEFTITCKNGSRTTSVAKFASYVERTIAIPEGVAPGKITTAAVFNQDGSLAHVPTKIIIRDGKYYAKISSLSNSVYTLIYNQRAFADMENHWAEQAVNDMGSRLVISGVSDENFEPGREITRAEFAAIIVRGLGLKPENGSQIFADVDGSQWYSSYINTAYQYGIISGYGAGTFGPADRITREQAMSMIARAMDITGLEIEFGAGEAEALLAQFTDTNEAAVWAHTSIAECVKAGIITGQGGSLLAAKDQITRAEVAVIIKKLLQQSDLI